MIGKEVKLLTSLGAVLTCEVVSEMSMGLGSVGSYWPAILWAFLNTWLSVGCLWSDELRLSTNSAEVN